LQLDKAKDFEDLGEYDRALQQYEKVIEKFPDNFLPLCNKALFLESIERFEKALEVIK
jgi:tetratricopeptide (TPR) repeat protein